MQTTVLNKTQWRIQVAASDAKVTVRFSGACEILFWAGATVGFKMFVLYQSQPPKAHVDFSGNDGEQLCI